MGNKKENFFNRHMTSCFYILILLAVYTGYQIYAYCAKAPMRNLHEVSQRALYGTAHSFTCPVKYAGKDARLPWAGTKQVQLRDHIPGALCGSLLYNKSQSEIIVMITWFGPTIFGGQFHYFYEITSSDVKADLLKFITDHEDDLQNCKLQEGMLGMFYYREDELKKLGDGDPYIGLERAGVAEWIKAGKDPEAEWRKKYPAESL